MEAQVGRQDASPERRCLFTARQTTYPDNDSLTRSAAWPLAGQAKHSYWPRRPLAEAPLVSASITTPAACLLRS